MGHLRRRLTLSDLYFQDRCSAGQSVRLAARARASHARPVHRHTEVAGHSKTHNRRAIPRSSHGHDDCNDSGCDRRDKRDQNRTTPDLLSTEYCNQNQCHDRHAEHRIGIAGCRPDQEDDYGDCPKQVILSGVHRHLSLLPRLVAERHASLRGGQGHLHRRLTYRSRVFRTAVRAGQGARPDRRYDTPRTGCAPV
jgi:hypothetical protein